MMKWQASSLPYVVAASPPNRTLDRGRVSMAKCILRLVVFVVLSAGIFRIGSAADGIKKTTEKVAMHDGVHLATDIYHPESQNGPLPVILMRTPYDKNNGAKGLSAAAVKHGYVLVIQDMRGRFASEGNDSVVFHNDGWGSRRDGQESLEWIVRQPWCNGSIATQGGSALGITQTMMAPNAPSSLKAQFVQVAFDDMYSQGTYQGGVWRKSLIEWWLKASHFDPKSFETFVKHPDYDAFWAEANAEAQASRIDVPGIYWGGWYDIFQQGTINSFVSIQSHGGPHARGQCRLILGPYAHGPFEGLKYPASAGKQPQAADAFRFFDYHLKGIDHGVSTEKPVHYYVMGDPEAKSAPGNFWRSADTWPPPSQPTAYYFHADGRLSAAPPASAKAEKTYRYDPKDPVPTLGGQNLVGSKGPADLRPIESRNDVLVFSTEPLEQPLEVTGRISAELFIASDCPDTDFTAMLADVYPDGRSMLVTDGILRTRFRKSLDHEELLEPSQTYKLEVDLWSTSLIFNKGHRVRVLISSSNSPRFDPNPNTGHPFRADKQTRIATNTVRLSAGHPSHIILPIYREPSPGGARSDKVSEAKP
jgi:predicted acyl esterase